MRGIGICLLAFAAGMGLWAYNYVYHPRPNHLPPPRAAVQAPPPPKLAAAPAPPPVIADPSAPGPRYVHRAGSVLRDKPKASGHTLKKEMKGAKVILEALEQGGWARVTDGNIRGWMRASVLGAAPPAP
jgi:hypothetical protein